MINGTIKDYTITTLQNILGVLVIKKGTQTKEFKTLQGMNLHTHELDNINIHMVIYYIVIIIKKKQVNI